MTCRRRSWPGVARARFAFVARRDGCGRRQRVCASRLSPATIRVSVDWLRPDGEPVVRGRPDRDASRDRSLRYSRRSARAQLPLSPFGGRDPHARIRRRRRRRRIRRRGFSTRERRRRGCGRSKRRPCARAGALQPPREPFGGGDDQGQPPRGPADCGRGRDAHGVCGPGGWWRSSARTSRR